MKIIFAERSWALNLAYPAAQTAPRRIQLIFAIRRAIFGSRLKARSKRSDQEAVRIRASDPIAVSTAPSRLESLGTLGNYSGWLSLVIADTPHFSQTRSIFATQLFWFTTLKPFGR